MRIGHELRGGGGREGKRMVGWQAIEASPSGGGHASAQERDNYMIIEETGRKRRPVAA